MIPSNYVQLIGDATRGGKNADAVRGGIKGLSHFAAAVTASPSTGPVLVEALYPLTPADPRQLAFNKGDRIQVDVCAACVYPFHSF